MKKTILTFIIMLAAATAKAQKLVEVAPAYSNTSVNTTVFRNNSIVSHGKWQFISFYDADGYLTLGKRKRGKGKWQIKRSQYKGNVKDAHNVISIIADGDGYLHVAFDHHGHKLHYARSLKPMSLELGDMEPMTGKDEGNVTYPEFYTLENGDLLFAYRSGASGRGNLVLNRYYVKTRTWERVQDVLIDGEDKRNAYWQMYVDEEGTIHLSWVWRETWLVETNHDLCYARSEDGGKTWTRTDGTPYRLPITAANAEYACRIPQNSELINQTSMSAHNGNPYIATYWRDAESSIPQYRMVWHDGEKWNTAQVGERKTPFTLKGGGTKMIPIARPRMVADNNDIYYITRDAETGSHVAIYHTDYVKSRKWEKKNLTEFAVNAWEPSIDTELWKSKRQLHIFVQQTNQGDGEKTVVSEPTMVYVLEVER